MRVKILGISFGIIISICLAGGLSCLNLQEETQEEKQNSPSIWNETQGLNTSEGPQREELMLSDFPDVFKNDTIIVIGENASQIETESAEAIAIKLENLTGNMTIIINDTALTENNKTNCNLILVGTPKSNSLLQEVYNLTNATRVTEEYPGSGKGILEILCNPWNEEKAMLLVEGSDEWGVKAGGDLLTENEKIKELSGGITVTAETNESWVIAKEDDLLGKYEESDKIFKRYEIGNMIVYWHQRMIDDAIVEFDYIRYEFDKNTKEFIEKDVHWREDLPEHLPPIISSEQVESTIRGQILSTKLYYISPESNVFPIKPTPKNPCWVVRSIDDGRMVITIIDAVYGEILGYGVPPPNRLIETEGRK